MEREREKKFDIWTLNGTKGMKTVHMPDLFKLIVCIYCEEEKRDNESLTFEQQASLS